MSGSGDEGIDDDGMDDGGPRLADTASAPEAAAADAAGAPDDGLRPGVQVPPHGRQEELPLVETLTADEAARAAEQADTITAADLPVLVPDTTDLPPAELRAVVEGLLFVSSRPLSIEKLQECLPGSSAGYLQGFLAGLAERFDAENRGWELRRIAGGWQLLTRRTIYPWVRQLERRELPTRLSKSALETLAIVAYKQPITRGEVEDIRGVQCGPVLRQLMDLKLVIVTGRAESMLGRPLLYATSEQFLHRFGLGAIEDLPKKHEFGA
jgi:segregation and condensation protein B